jgi:hypothetical protein
MSSEEKLRRLGLSIDTLKQMVDSLKEHAKIALTDKSKVESLSHLASDIFSAVNDCSNRYEDYKLSLGH